MRILITGAAGSIGTKLVPALEELGHDVIPTDILDMDVRYPEYVDPMIKEHLPDVVYHLAADKHAPQGEIDPHRTAVIDMEGTWNVIRGCEIYSPHTKLILASTCKACDPETAYGAAKLISEKMILNAGGTVLRFYNVRETAGNVFRIWEEIPEDEPIPYTDCVRYFITLQDSIDLCLAGLNLPPGKYTWNPGLPVAMYSEAHQLYPNRQLVEIPRRRGDRFEEPLKAECEQLIPVTDKIMKVVGYHDV